METLTDLGQSLFLPKDGMVFIQEYSEWTVELFGMGSGFVLRPLKGDPPCWFHRVMQRLCFGNVWKKDKKQGGHHGD